MSNAEIPSRIWKDAFIETRDSEAFHRIDILWELIGTMINEMTGNLFVCFDALRPSKQLWSCRDVTFNFMGLLPGIEMK